MHPFEAPISCEMPVTRRPAPDSSPSLQAYPNLTAAAEILGVSASTLSRRDDLATERRGERDIVISPAEVLRLAAIYRKRSLNDVAQALLDRARDASPDDRRRIEDELETFFEERAITEPETEQFLSLARQLLPSSLVHEIERVLQESGAELPGIVQGWPPHPKA